MWITYNFLLYIFYNKHTYFDENKKFKYKNSHYRDREGMLREITSLRNEKE